MGTKPRWRSEGGRRAQRTCGGGAHADMGRHKWALDFSDSSGDTHGLPTPPGYFEQQLTQGDDRLSAKKEEARDSKMQLKLKKAREVSWSPIKNFMQMGLMLWMSGSGVHIFSIMITYQAISSPINACF